jgi:hypothetical protein
MAKNFCGKPESENDFGALELEGSVSRLGAENHVAQAELADHRVHVHLQELPLPGPFPGGDGLRSDHATLAAELEEACSQPWQV